MQQVEGKWGGGGGCRDGQSIQGKEAQVPLCHSCCKEELDSRAQNVFSRYCTGEERFSYEEEKAKVGVPHCRDLFGDIFYPKNLKR